MQTIFVSVASYRDQQCSRTLQSIFEMANSPDRVYVGICQQNKHSKENCLPNNFKWKKNIRSVDKSYKEAKGPTYARYICSTLFNNEDFFLQIDSHSHFVKDWDVKCIQMMKDLENEKSIKNKKVLLSHYPPDDTSYFKNQSDKYVTHMVNCFFNHEGILTFHGATWKTPEKLPRRNAFIAGGFFFSPGAFIKEVPFDPHLDYLFTGEEILFSARAFTHGWDVYTPNRNIVYHTYVRKKEPKFWDDHHYRNDEIKEKVKIITGLGSDMKKLTTPRIRNSVSKYNIGSKRSLKDFYNFIGVDPKTKTIGNRLVEFYQNKPLAALPTKSPCCDRGNIIIMVLICCLITLFLT